jgi:N-acetylmuramoyl-L-alanine amidase
MNHGIWEHDYVYDVACRLKQKLERESAATVILTLQDAETGCLPSSGDALVANRQGTVRSTPPFLADADGESSIAVHLRWYVANSVFRRSVRKGTNPDRVVFLSLHADSRHPSLRGLMAYVPGAQHRSGSFGPLGSSHARFEEVREAPRVKLTRAQRVRAEAVSRRLAGAIVRSFGRASLPVQPVKPVRNEVIRGGGRWLPAVLRGNAIPASVLVELVNMGNPDDAALLATASARDHMAGALFGSIYSYFGEDRPAASGAAASR